MSRAARIPSDHTRTMSCWHVATTSSTGHSRTQKVQTLSPSKCTDFSIDSILSNKKKSSHGKSESAKNEETKNSSTKSPDVAKMSKRKRKLSRNPRVPFTSLQLTILETHFKMNAYISGIDVTYLSLYLGLSPNKIKVWFQNRRARERRHKKKISGNPVLPPVQFSLPAPPFSSRNQWLL